MRRAIIAISIALGIALLACAPAGAIRIKDMASVYGVRSNQLIGYGLVVGLNGSGDKSGAAFTAQGLSNMLTRMGVKVMPGDVNVKNVAAVMVTAQLPPFARAGNRIDVTLSSMGDASSLAGGTLVMTPLKGIDGQVYAVAQGPVSVGGFLAGGEAATVSKNHPTVGRIPSGATVEREVPYRFGDNPTLTVNLETPDFTTANRVAMSIQRELPQLRARALDPSTIRIDLPQGQRRDYVAMMARLENIEVKPDVSAKVVVDERTGTVVMGEAVRISTVAVASGALSISITESADVSQPLPFSGGETVVTPQTEVQVTEDKPPMKIVPRGISIGDVVKGLNALGASPRDLIVILQAIQAAGALQAELEII